MHSLMWWSAVIAVACLTACGSEATGAAGNVVPADRDAGAPSGAGLAAGTIDVQGPQLPPCLRGDNPPGCAAPPQLPACLQGDNPPGCAAPPKLQDWPCAPGWLPEKVGEGEPWAYSICVPPEPPSCPDGEVAWLGETKCHAIGTACPAEDFHDEATIRSLAPTHTGHVRYVKPGGTGSGAASSPFGTIAAALAVALPGDIVALAQGTYDEAVVLSSPVALVGSCVGGTTVRAPGVDEEAATILITGDGADVANLRVSGKRTGIWVTGAGASGVVAKVETKGALRQGMLVSAGAAATLGGVVVRDTGARPSDGTLGRGMEVSSGAQVAADHAVLERNRDVGVMAGSAGTAASFTNLLVRDMQSQETGQTGGTGLQAREGAKMSVERGMFSRNRGAAIYAAHQGTTVLLGDVIVAGTRGQESDGGGGRGVNVQGGAIVRVERAVLEQNRGAGIFAGGPGSTASLTDAVVRETLGQDVDKRMGRGANAQDGAAVSVTRVLFERNRTTGIFAVRV